jgi:hypothetical protein
MYVRRGRWITFLFNQGKLTIKVTILGEFLPNGFIATLDNFLKITKVAQIYELFLSTVKVMH